MAEQNTPDQDAFFALPPGQQAVQPNVGLIPAAIPIAPNNNEGPTPPNPEPPNNLSPSPVAPAENKSPSHGEAYESLKLNPTPKGEIVKDTTEHEDSIVENLMIEYSKETTFHGSIGVEDLKDMLKLNGDFVVRAADAKGRRAPDGTVPVALVSVRVNENIRDFPLMFLKHGTDLKERLVTMNGLFVKSSIADLLKDNVTLVEKIGEGAFGSVWKGKMIVEKPSPRTKDVAVKVTKISDENKQKMEEMMMEARMMRQLNHPNVVAFYGMVADGGQAMIVMELVNGGSLDNHLKKNKDITLLEKCSYCFDVAYGLYYLHTKRTIHRDMAARNCLIDTVNSVVKISDFGMSKQDTRYRIQATDKTPIRWQAPEVLKKAVYTKECDVYSFGMVMYEIFNNGKVPFEGVDNKIIRVKIHDPSFRPKLPDDVPIEILAVMKTAWEADPSKRCSMRTAASVLQKFRKRSPPKSGTDEKEKSKTKGANRPSRIGKAKSVADKARKSKSKRKTARNNESDH